MGQVITAQTILNSFPVPVEQIGSLEAEIYKCSQREFQDWIKVEITFVIRDKQVMLDWPFQDTYGRNNIVGHTYKADGKPAV